MDAGASRHRSPLQLFVGQRWLSSDPNRFLLQLPTGRHTIAITKMGYRGFETEVDVTEATSVLLNISLVLESQ